MNAQVRWASPPSCHCWKSNGGQAAAEGLCWLFPLTNLPETVPGTSRKMHEVCLLDFQEFFFGGVAPRKHIFCVIWHGLGRFLVAISLKPGSLCASCVSAGVSPTFTALESGWVGWVLVCSGRVISYKGLSEGCLNFLLPWVCKGGSTRCVSSPGLD